MSSALDLLQHEELCVVVLEDGQQREATWSRHNPRFFFTEAPPGSVTLSQIEEWWLASVKF